MVTMDKITPPQQEDKRKTIADYSKAGYCLIPLRGKIPIESKWQETPPGKYTAAQLIAVNYGVALKAGDLVLDVDPRNFTKGDKPLTRLIKDIGVPLGSTFTVRTGGGGVHVYLRKPPDFAVCGDLSPKYQGIEIKSLGRQVVGPGSIHPESGKPYEIIIGGPLTVLDAPAVLLQICKAQGPKTADFAGAAGLNEYKDDDATRNRYSEYLKTQAPTSGTYAVACRGRDLALPPEITWKLMVEHWSPRRLSPRTPEDLKVKVIHAYKYAKSPLGASHPAADYQKIVANPNPVKNDNDLAWKTNKQGVPTNCFQNLLNYLRSPSYGLQKLVGYNEFTGRYEFQIPAPWHRGRMPHNAAVSDHDLKLLKGYLVARCGIESAISTIEEAVANVAHDNRFHPVREYLEGLEGEWDGKPRLSMWLHDFVGVDNTAYTQACARKTICAAVMRIMKPGIKFDHVLVLEGAQDIGKSSVCKILGGEWSADFTVDPHNKDTIQLMQGKWIIELAELEMTRRSDTEAIKAFLSRDTDTARLAYGRLTSEFPRQSIFIASKNPQADGTYLKDDTGNRRWWPVECHPKGGQVDFKGLKAARNQIFAEAVALIKTKGEKLYMETKSLKKDAKAVVDLRRAAPMWMETISAWLWKLAPEDRGFVTTRQVYTLAIGGIDISMNRKHELQIADAMRGLGYVSKTCRVNGKVLRGYVPTVELVEDVEPVVEETVKTVNSGIFEGF